MGEEWQNTALGPDVSIYCIDYVTGIACMETCIIMPVTDTDLATGKGRRESGSPDFCETLHSTAEVPDNIMTKSSG